MPRNNRSCRRLNYCRQVQVGNSSQSSIMTAASQETRPFHCAAGFLHRRSPGAAAANRGFQAWVLVWRGTTPHRVTVLQLRRLQRVLVITVQCKTREPKREAPRGGLISRGHSGSMLAGVQLEHYPSTNPSRIGITGTTPESFSSVILVPLKDSRTKCSLHLAMVIVEVVKLGIPIS